MKRLVKLGILTEADVSAGSYVSSASVSFADYGWAVGLAASLILHTALMASRRVGEEAP